MTSLSSSNKKQILTETCGSPKRVEFHVATVEGGSRPFGEQKKLVASWVTELYFPANQLIPFLEVKWVPRFVHPE